jgi:serine/threonine protein kinase
MTWLREPNAEPIPGYRLIEPLGNGGFGEVWKCEAPGGLFKAIKFVYGNLNSMDVEGVRAEQELHALQRVKEVRHPFICSMDRIEQVEGELVIVMELAERTLYDLYVECQGAGLIGIPRENLLRYLRDAAEALDYMNEKHNLQHLDVKPRNLFVIGDRVKVADFGLVKHLERQSASGLLGGVTPLYAPPETFNGKISDKSDQYSLAIVYQEMLTGQRPFAGKNVRQLAQQHLQEDPDLRALPEAERPIVARALAKDPAERFANCKALVAALYRARFPTPVAEPANQPPKTIADTMEDIQLEGISEDNGREEAAVHPIHTANGNGKLKALAAEAEDIAVSQLGLTIPAPETGSLRPTLILGVGAFGRKGLLELRCRFLDRFGDLNKLPLLRFLCVDPDPEAVNTAIRGAPEVALSRNEVFHLPLQPVGNYRRRSLEQLSEWLPREKLYAMPRSLQTQGSRSLGRLAFADNQQRLMARLKREIQEITNPDVLYQSVTQTGLALRDNTPRIYVIAAAGGGASGLLCDLGYALRRQLAQLRHPDAQVTCLLFGGAPTDPATPKLELANIYATLTELNHFSDPAISFAAQYGVDGQRIVDQGSPYTSTYVMPLAHRSPAALDEVVAHLGSYLFHELTTPLGLRLDSLRSENNEASESGKGGPAVTSLRSLGTYAIWFPRGLLLRLAARQACRRLVEGWLASGNTEITSEAASAVQAFMERVQTDPALESEQLASQIESAAPGSLNELAVTPGEALTRLLATLDEQSIQPVAQDDPGNWARQAANRVREWVGVGGDANPEINDWRKTRLNRSLAQAAQKVADIWIQKLSQDLFTLMEFPGARLAAAESALDLLQKFFQAASQSLNVKIEQQGERSAQAWKQVETALDGCLTGGGGFRLFGGRSKTRQLRHFLDHLSQFARQRLAEEVLWAVRYLYVGLGAKLAERVRDLGFCRQRLRHLQEHIESGPCVADEELGSLRPSTEFTLARSPLPSTESFWEAIRQSATARVVLPDAEEDLERAAIRFLQSLTPEQWVNLDKELHERVLLHRGGLNGACTQSGDLSRILAVPLMTEAIQILSEHLPIMDVAQILANEFGLSCDAGALVNPAANPKLGDQARTYLDRAAPLIAGKNSDRQQGFLLVPASPAGKALGEAVRNVLPEIKLVRVPGQSDLMFCLEQGFLGVEELRQLLRSSRKAYDAVVGSPPTSPHARFDIVDWVPLDP